MSKAFVQNIKKPSIFQRSRNEQNARDIKSRDSMSCTKFVKRQVGNRRVVVKTGAVGIANGLPCG